MNNPITDLIKNKNQTDFATQNGKIAHTKLQNIVIDGDTMVGDAELIGTIQSVPGLSLFFTSIARTEVPVAGFINNTFCSRRIDRMVIDDKTIKILDYKTDTDSSKFKDKYIKQLHEYKDLIQQIYPKHTIELYILWLHDWRLELI